MKKWMGMAVLLLLLLMISACSGDNEKKTKQNQRKEETETTLTLTYASGDSAWNQAIDTVARGFMKKYPNIIIQLSTGTSNSGFYNDFLKSKDAIGELGDIVEITNVREYAMNQRIVPLPEEVTSLVNSSTAYQGETYAVTTISMTQGIIYNKKIFQQIGLEVPSNYEEFLSLCDKIRKYKLNPIIVGGKDIWHLGFWSNHFFRNDVLAGNANWQQDRNLGLVSWKDEGPTQMLTHIYELFHKNYVNEDYLSISDSATAGSIASGQSVMLYSGPWMFNQIYKLNPKIQLGWFYLPADNGESVIFNNTPAGFAITKECAEEKEKYDAAILFLKYFYSKEVYTQICEIMNAMPVTKEEIMTNRTIVQEQVLSEFQNAKYKTSHYLGDENTPEGFNNDMLYLITDFIENKYTLDEVQAMLDQKWEEDIGVKK